VDAANPREGEAIETEIISFSRRQAWRLSAWAGLALVAVAGAYLAARSEIGAQRLAGVTESKPAATRGTQLAGRPFDAEIEARRLNEAVRLLAADRDRLLARINTLERNLDDVTGSVGQAATGKPSASPGPASSPLPPALAPGAAQPSPSRLAPEATGRQTPEQQAALPALEPIPQGHPQEAAQPQAPAAQAPARPSEPASGTARTAPEQPSAAPPPAAQRSGTPASPAQRATAGHAAVQPGPGAAESTVTRTEFGIDVGGHTTMEGLRTLWTSLRGSHGALFEGLRPVMAVREGKRAGQIELRLIAGPLANAGAAARLCAALSAAGKACQPAVFDGQRLALQ
jgi:hypothetical protein